MSSRELILGSLSAKDVAYPAIAARPAAGEDLWAKFGEELALLGGEVHTLADLKEIKGKCWIEPDVPAAISEGLARATDIWEAEVGLTIGDFAIAESGTIAIGTGYQRSRLASLAPPHHIALLPKDRIVANLEELFEKLKGRTHVFITGPSRTADIEGVLVRGIHGPKRLWVIPF